jgi:hypothetical protein
MDNWYESLCLTARKVSQGRKSTFPDFEIVSDTASEVVETEEPDNNNELQENDPAAQLKGWLNAIDWKWESPALDMNSSWVESEDLVDVSPREDLLVLRSVRGPLGGRARIVNDVVDVRGRFDSEGRLHGFCSVRIFAAGGGDSHLEASFVHGEAEGWSNYHY